MCLRCGQTGHWARNCPQAAGSGSSQVKRPRSDDDDAMTMMAEGVEEWYHATQPDAKPSNSVLEGGAVSFLIGQIVFDRYLAQIKDLGYARP
eukprot:11455289-Heterocapsa_arctica.AAC.1